MLRKKEVEDYLSLLDIHMYTYIQMYIYSDCQKNVYTKNKILTITKSEIRNESFFRYS